MPGAKRAGGSAVDIRVLDALPILALDITVEAGKLRRVCSSCSMHGHGRQQAHHLLGCS